MKVILALVLLASPMVMAQESGAGATQRTPPVQESESAGPTNAYKDREELTSLINVLKSTLEAIGSATAQVSNVRRIFEKLDQGAIKATEQELVKTNQLMRQSLTKELRELRARSRSVLTQVSTTLLPKQRGVSAKLKARFEIEPDAEMKSKIGKLLGDHEQAMAEASEQMKRLATNIQQLSGAIQILERQLSYLDLVEESLSLSTEVSSQLRALNQEIEKYEPQASSQDAAKKPAAPADPMAEIDKFAATLNVDKSSSDWRTTLRMPPRLSFDPQSDYFWHIDTAAGAFKIKLFADTAPMHVSSCLFLNKLGFYDGLRFHRIIPGFMAQGGCPTGTGRDGPGYKFAGEYEGGRKHDRPGLLSMANGGAGTDGSQFFLTFAPTPWLDGKHTLWGEVVEGMETLKALEKLGTPGGEVSNPPLIKKAWVTAVKKDARWSSVHAVDAPNAIDFVAEPHAFDGFRRFAATWPNHNNKDSMNERLLASFLNLRDWQMLTGAMIFGQDALVATGQVELNNLEHTGFQSSFYKAEHSQRQKWLDPFLGMVPESACACAALRMTAAEFMTEMFDALQDPDKELINDALRRVQFQGQQLHEIRDLIERLRHAFLPHIGFVFRKNDPDTSRDESGKLMVPVTAKSPVPQVAWVFWLERGAAAKAEELVTMLRTNYSNFRFQNVRHLPVSFGNSRLQEPVTEFTNPLIPGTGELAMIVFGDFFVLSNSGPLVRDILRTHHSRQTGALSLRDTDEWKRFEGPDPDRSELANSLDGLVWIDGQKVLPLIDDYVNFAAAASDLPDPVWMMENRPSAEETVRRADFARYPSKAAIPKPMTDEGGEFEVAVTNHLKQQWQQARTNFTAKDRADMQQLRAMFQMLRSASLQLELENNYVRFQARLAPMWR